ncbi:unnamed protein product [Lota lota]
MSSLITRIRRHYPSTRLPVRVSGADTQPRETPGRVEYSSERLMVAGSIVLHFNPGRGTIQRDKRPREQEPHLQWPPYGSPYGSRWKNHQQHRHHHRVMSSVRVWSRDERPGAGCVGTHAETHATP